MSALLRLDQGLWIADQPLAFAGLELGARMTVMQLSSGAVVLHSPIRPTPALLDEVRAQGPVAAILAPNRFHHLFAKPWLDAFPDAALHVAPGLDRKRPDLRVSGVLSDAPESLWKDDIDQVLLAGIPMTNEVVFFHRATKTLVATDLAFHIGPGHGTLTRIAFRLFGAYGRLAPTAFERLLIRNSAAFRASLERILAWPFERVIVAHGDVLERGGREALASGYQWILGKR